ncbi:hypothetical protein K432DRAFT_358416 [Lepidopterella palustris CBS 459.81]|uniref:Uncharacterized protein n=1 Tax=Lepidopterella palustris CBS 459.81 TaxID=1314670 RepID=A0A8E2E578_9PEZI|nr:hypothetical protein K432DRAFT_358416 [Lepidopterella palustris CBS 459.81]
MAPGARKRACNSDAGNEEDDAEGGFDLDIGDGSSTRKRRRAELPRKPANLNMIHDSQYKSMMVAMEAEADMPKKKKADTAQSAQWPTNGKGKGKGKASKAKETKSQRGKKFSRGKKKGGKSKALKYSGPRMNNVGSLFTSNVFRDQDESENLPAQPKFDATRKEDALKQLIASVPLEHQKSSRTDKNVLLAATKDFTGQGACRADGNGRWLVRGMKSSLEHYQLLGSAFMRRRENAAEEPRGGLVADQMGLGKTVMMLANIINGRPPKGEQPRTTLIVASPALVTQCTSEIEKHCEEKAAGIIMTFGSGHRISSNRGLEILQSHDIILTTYSEVMRSLPKNEPPVELQTVAEKQAWWKHQYDTFSGPLHKIMFYRIILDEAQAIKCHTGRTSVACRALMAKHKWALSGTPVLNTITELYPYFKFLNVPHTGSFRIFKLNYCSKTDPDKATRLLARLNQFMIRRTHNDIMFGAPILSLPKNKAVTLWCEFNDVERSVYEIVRRRFIQRINMYAQNRQLEKCYTHVFVMILRLRQLTGHILTLQLVMNDLLEREDIERLRQVTKNEAAGDSERGRQIISIRNQLTALAKKPSEGHGPNSCLARFEPSPEPNPSPDVIEDHNIEAQPEIMNDAGGGFGRSFDFGQYLKTMTEGQRWKEIKEKTLCGQCHKTPESPWVTSCHHIYCKKCLETMQFNAAKKEKEHASCVACGTSFPFAQACEEDPESQDVYSAISPSDDNKNPKQQRKKGEKKQRVRPEREQIADDWIEMKGSVLPSAKTLAIKAQVLNWLAQDPKVKIIIYTQFLAIIRILVKICNQEGWEYCEYHGNMSFGSRDKAIREFADNSEKKILLASLRCGGLGLNLTMASRVIIIDPWWNQALEQQAFCRVFRIGQQQKTFMTRFCVRDTIDQRLIDMQDRKQSEIDEIMEDDGSTLAKLSIKDLMRLFGPVGEEEDGTPFILVDDPVDNSGYAAGSDGDFENDP